MTPELRSLGALVSDAAYRAVKHPLRHDFELKPDGSVVTKVDILTEELLRQALTSDWKETNVWGEELGHETMGPNGLWLVDPIDGTSNYFSGNPLWGVSVALMDKHGLRLGAVVLPELGIELLAERDGGAFWNGNKLPVSDRSQTKPHELISVNDSAIDILGAESLIVKPRLCGAFVVDGAFTVRGWFSALYGMNEKLYDVAASVLAAREIGLEVRYCDGSEWSEHHLSIDKKISKPWRIGGA